MQVLADTQKKCDLELDKYLGEYESQFSSTMPSVAGGYGQATWQKDHVKIAVLGNKEFDRYSMVLEGGERTALSLYRDSDCNIFSYYYDIDGLKTQSRFNDMTLALSPYNWVPVSVHQNTLKMHFLDDNLLRANRYKIKLGLDTISVRIKEVAWLLLVVPFPTKDEWTFKKLQ